MKREPDPNACEKHGAPKCYECLREHHLQETKFLIGLLERFGCLCGAPPDELQCNLHHDYPYLFAKR